MQPEQRKFSFWNILTRLEQYYHEAKENKWYRYFTVFCRIALALGFIISGMVKINGERFASGLPVNNPMGHYLEALLHTGYYYNFIGITQVTISMLLLIPGTAILGAIFYFPIILNICILAYATRFEGTRITTLMLLANMYLLWWDYERLKYLLPFKQYKADISTSKNKTGSNKFPFLFFFGIFATAVSVIVINQFLYKIRPGNSEIECRNGCIGNKYPGTCEFCDCIYVQGKPLDKCLEEFKQATEKRKE